MDINKLTKAEEEIMHLIWNHGPTTVSALIGRMSEPHPPHSTISSIVRILERKSFLDHQVYGRTYQYFPLITKIDYSRYSIKRIISKYFEGSMNQLVTFLVKENELSVYDLSQIVEQLTTEDKL